jgi:hypothetical protein
MNNIHLLCSLIEQKIKKQAEFIPDDTVSAVRYKDGRIAVQWFVESKIYLVHLYDEKKNPLEVENQQQYARKYSVHEAADALIENYLQYGR